MSKKKKDIVHKDLLIRVLEHCYPKKVFTLGEIKKHFKLTSTETNYLEKYTQTKRDSMQMFEMGDPITDANLEDEVNPFRYLRLTPIAIFNYLEYVELVEAKKNAIESKKLALLAIGISVAAILTPIIIQVIQSLQVTS